MANFDQLKQSVAALIRTNGAEEITGQIMQDVLLTIINSISGGYMFGGVAQHSGNVGNPDYNVFYLAGSGAYTGYGDAINIPNGCYGVFRYNGSWTQDVVDIGVHLTGTIREGETNGVTGDVINTALQQLFNNVMNILDTLTFTYNTPSAQQATKSMLDVIVTPTGGASHVLTTLTLASATAAAAGLMSAEDKQKVDRMLTDFRSLSFSDTTAVADQATKIVQTLYATLGENPEAITTMTFLAATASKAGLMSAADKEKLDALWADGYKYIGVATPETTPVSTTQKIYYIATEEGTYTNFGSISVTQGINILSWNGSAWSAVQVIGIDDEPTADSNNLVESGGVYDALETRVQQATVVADINRDYAYNARINTEAKSIDGSRNRYILNRVSPNYHLFNSDIIDNIWTSSDGSYCSISYFQMLKGETIQLKFKNGASQARKVVRGFWLNEKPIFETTSFSDKKVFDFALVANDDNYRYLEHTAKEDGYLVIRFVFGTGCDFQASKYDDFSAIQDYVEEELNRMPLIRLRGIDADEDSVSYGDEIDIGDTTSSSTTNGCTDYVDIHEYKYLKLYVTNGTNPTVSTINYGTVYYNSDKEPIKTDSIWQRVNIVSSEYHYSKVPEGAYYIRITQYSKEQRADLVHLAEKICGYKTLKAESKRDIEARVDTLESKYQSDVKTKTVTLVPQTQDTYKYYVNVFNASKPVVYSIKRLSYVPELYTIGGTTLTVKYTGADTKSLRICQYSFIPKGTYITNFTVDKFIKIDSFPNSDSEDFTGTATVTLDKECKRVLIFITSGTTEEVTVSPFDILNYITEVQLEQEDGYITAKDDEESNIENIVRQSRFVEDSGNVTANALTLVHCTDIHEDEASINDVLKFHSLGLSEDILCTGDIPVSYPDSTTYHADVIEWLAETGLMQKSLFVLGNHDGATNAATEEDPVVVHGSAWDGKGQDWDFDNYFADYIDGVGYVMPEGYDDEESEYYKACYWHKDYASQKIRLIGIDCIHRFDGIVDPATGEITSPGLKQLTNEQEVWFIEKLNETLDPENDAYGYSVVVAGHYPLDDFSGDNEEWDESTHKFVYNHKNTGGRTMSYKTGAPVNFHLETTTSYSAEKGFSMRNRTGSSYTSSFGKGDVNNIAAIITSWMQRNGKFVAYVCGHVHRDRMYYSTKYPDILVIACDQAGTLRPSHTGVRNHAYGSGTAFNVITIDTQNGLIKLIREGFVMNQFLNSHKYMCYDYINKKVLNEG